MTNPMFRTDRPSALNLRSGFGKGARPRPRRVNHKWQVAAQIWLLEDRCLMSDMPMPGDVMGANPAIFNGLPPSMEKTITIFNNYDHTIYPFFVGTNSTADTKDPLHGLYDNQDLLNQSYRAYIGYYSGPNQTDPVFGLQKHQSITISVPLVFWDGGRLDIATNDEYMTPDAQQGAPNNPIDPFNYYTKNSDGSLTTHYILPAKSSTETYGGAIMYYHATTAIAPATDAPVQLTEFTFRDKNQQMYAPNMPSDQELNLINYDVSYVDGMNLPVAMEATNAVPVGTTLPPAPLGWLGSNLSVDDMQKKIKDFISTGSANGLGDYFEGQKGYDYYYSPDYDANLYELPSGTNLIQDSPPVRSSYDNNQFRLVSGGIGPVHFGPQGFLDDKGDKTLKIASTPAIDAAGDKMIGMEVAMAPGQDGAPTIQAGTVITGVNIVDQKVVSVTVNHDLPKPTTKPDWVFVFDRPATDYVASKLTDLWYSWANYYVTNTQTPPSMSSVTGNIAAQSNELTLSTSVTGLEPGMGVTSSLAGQLAPGTTILSVNSNNSIELSTLAIMPNTDNSSTFTFALPTNIARTDGVTTPTLNFADNGPTTNNYLFSQRVYQVMSAMATITVDPFTTQNLMNNVIGENIGKISYIGIPPSGEIGNAGIPNTYRGYIKSIMRGVVDFQNPATLADWYPDPAMHTPDATFGGTAANFNVYNLDPFVFFVHKTLKLSGYGFSLDDDTSDVGAPGATDLQVAVGGTTGLLKPDARDEWTPGAPFGVVSSDGNIDYSTNQNTITGLDPATLQRLIAPDPAGGVSGALVTGFGVVPGTRILKLETATNSIVLTQDLMPGSSGTHNYQFSGFPLPEARAT